MAVTLTDEAIGHISRMLAQRGHGLGLRLGTKKSGCTGYAYVVDYADEIGAQDTVFESKGVIVVVDNSSLPQIDGMELHFSRANMLNQGFEFRNPNVKNMCGCGESFDIIENSGT